METTLAAPPTRTITLRPDVYDTLLHIAAREGKNVEVVADEMLTETLRQQKMANLAPQNGPTLMEIIAPLQEDFEATGMTDDALADFIAGEIAAHRKEKASKIG